MKKGMNQAKSLQGLHLHLDPVSGIAGDMTVAALVDAGVPSAVVVDAVAAVGVPGLHVRFETRKRGAFVGRGFIVDEPPSAGERAGRARTRAGTDKQHHLHQPDHKRVEDHLHPHPHVHDHDHHHTRRAASRSLRSSGARKGGDHLHRDYAEIRRLLTRAKLDADAKALAQDLFERLAHVEAALHGTPLERVAFHEIGAFDSIADIVGMAAAIAWLAPVSIGSSPPVVGTGTVRTAHGIVAVPAPATAALMRGMPMIAEGQGELTTPTGAVFLAAVVDAFGPPPPLRLVSVGYGAGTRVIPDRANVLRVMLGEPIGQILPAAARDVVVLESNIDDMTGQLLAALSDALFKAGALDVWSTPIVMKKGRPAQQISALAEPSLLAAIERAFFLNSTTLGIRVYPVARRTLARSSHQVRTTFGAVGIKVAALDGEAVGSTPEYEDCRRQALAAGVPIRRVWTEAVAASAGLTQTKPSPPGVIKGRSDRGRKPKKPRGPRGPRG